MMVYTKERNLNTVTIFLIQCDLAHYAKYPKGKKNHKVQQWNIWSFQVLPMKTIR